MKAPGRPEAQAPTRPLPAGIPPGGEGSGGPGWAAAESPDTWAVRPRRRRFRRIKRFFGVLVALTVLAGIAFAGLLLVLPGVGNAPALARALDSAHHAAYLGSAVPPQLAASLIATEDHRFFSELGVDPAAVGRVVLGRITAAPDQGGSTLYQQLAKMLYVAGRSGTLAEAEEILVGMKLDLNYSKAQILQMYASVVYFGHGYYGLPAASCGYFGEQPARLSWGQAAMLAGLVQAPSADDPVTHFANARAREAHVLIRLVATRTLTPSQAAQAFRQPLHLVGAPATRCAA